MSSYSTTIELIAVHIAFLLDNMIESSRHWEIDRHYYGMQYCVPCLEPCYLYRRFSIIKWLVSVHCLLWSTTTCYSVEIGWLWRQVKHFIPFSLQEYYNKHVSKRCNAAKWSLWCCSDVRIWLLYTPRTLIFILILHIYGQSIKPWLVTGGENFPDHDEITAAWRLFV